MRLTFSSLGLCADLVRAVNDLGYRQPTPVQAAAIPAILRGGDLWASAKTGSGKTAAFVLPILQALSVRPPSSVRPVPVHGLLLVPTRELALQTAEAIRTFSVHLPAQPKICVAVGGLSINPQMMALRGGADLVVATPGRLLDLLEHNALRLTSVNVLVLDEADRLLSLGFADELSRVRAVLPARCQTLLFSATFPPVVRALAAGLLHEPTQINIDAGAPPDASAIVQRAIEVDVGQRILLLRHLLKTHAWSRVLVFVATKHATEAVSLKLRRAGLRAAPLHGDLSQGTRTLALADFKARRLQILVATDLAARGLDIADLAAVVNYDLPRSTVDYLHRIGRTGRAGETGVAVSFINAATDAHFGLIERRHRLSLARERIAGFEPTAPAVAPQHPHGGVKGKRRSKKDRLRGGAARRRRCRHSGGHRTRPGLPARWPVAERSAARNAGVSRHGSVRSFDEREDQPCLAGRVRQRRRNRRRCRRSAVHREVELVSR
jgi:ATP-dependent RNA helicase RhlE